MAKIVHLTSVHVAFDNRIFRKECAAAVAAGHDVILIAPHPRDEVQAAVRIEALRPPSNRFVRVTATVAGALMAAIRERADVYQFHDPELIPAGLMLRALRKNVIYDIHEDNVKSIAQKRHIPRAMRRILARLVGLAELVTCGCFELVLAERCYQRRFPRGTLVLNYPVLRQYDCIPTPTSVEYPPRVLYTGGVSEVRGAFNHVALLHQIPDLEVFMVGRCTVDLADELRRRAGPHVNRLHIVGEGRYVPFEEIMQYYERGGWLAGLALFPRTPHYETKELTKFFEYMAAGIPILCSDFPVWRQLIEGHSVGLCVRAEQPECVADRVQYLNDHPDDVREMGLKGQAVVQEYSWETQAAELLRLYQAILQRAV